MEASEYSKLAATLQTGDRLLNADGTWAEVLGAEAINEPLLAYNLTVEGFHTYFVAANENAAPVWVHNDYCNLPFGNLKDHFARHGSELGVADANAYLGQAISNVANGRRFRVRHNGVQKVAFITRVGPDSFMFTSTINARRILTHMVLTRSDLLNKGITLPNGF